MTFRRGDPLRAPARDRPYNRAAFVLFLYKACVIEMDGVQTTGRSIHVKLIKKADPLVDDKLALFKVPPARYSDGRND